MSKSPTTTELSDGVLPLIHPGEILFHEFLEPLGLSQYRLAHQLHVPPRRINEIVHGSRAVTADTALRLSRYFGTTAQFWLNLQSGYELRRAEREHGEEIASQVQPRATNP